jgi:hypothetical protein
MIPPTLIMVSPGSPIDRCRCCSPAAVRVVPGEVFATVFLQMVFVGNCCAQCADAAERMCAARMPDVS